MDREVLDYVEAAVVGDAVVFEDLLEEVGLHSGAWVVGGDSIADKAHFIDDVAVDYGDFGGDGGVKDFLAEHESGGSAADYGDWEGVGSGPFLGFDEFEPV